MFDLNIVRYNSVLDHKLPLKFVLIRLKYTQLLCYLIWGKLLHRYVRDGEHPNTILNGCAWYNGSMLCSSGGCYAKVCHEPFDIATFSTV